MANRTFSFKKFLGLLTTTFLAVIIALFFIYQFGTPIWVFIDIAAFIGISAFILQIWLLARIQSNAKKQQSIINNGIARAQGQEVQLLNTLRKTSMDDPASTNRNISAIQNAIADDNFLGIAKQKVSLWSWLLLAAIIIVSIALLVYAHTTGKPMVAALMVGLGTLSFWAALHWYFSKQPIFSYGGIIKYETEPGKYISSILAFIVIGVFLVYAGLRILRLVN